jgi:UDP-N-acetylglucosamine 2-epimerase
MSRQLARPAGPPSGQALRIVSVIGARPQFIKAAMVSRALRRHHIEVLVHTGQHYDANMSAIFFDELDIPAPDVNLEVGSGPHGAQTGAMLAGIEGVLLREHPAWVLVYGDTNSTLAGALAAAKLGIPVAHVEAGLRSFNRAMPEEINRVIADQLSTALFCPSQTAVDNLTGEGITRGVHLVGDVMADALAFAAGRAQSRSSILARLGAREGRYLLVTVHRPENTDDPARLGSILGALDALEEPVFFPVHPRTRKAIEALGHRPAPQVRLLEPLGYLDMVRLEQSARMILTDSGGVQKEAYWLGVPCVTLRNETEWVETVQAGWNVLVGAEADRIRQAVRTMVPPASRPPLYGDGRAADRCVAVLHGSERGPA